MQIKVHQILIMDLYLPFCIVLPPAAPLSPSSAGVKSMTPPEAETSQVSTEEEAEGRCRTTAPPGHSPSAAEEAVRRQRRGSSEESKRWRGLSGVETRLRSIPSLSVEKDPSGRTEGQTSFDRDCPMSQGV